MCGGIQNPSGPTDHLFNLLLAWPPADKRGAHPLHCFLCRLGGGHSRWRVPAATAAGHPSPAQRQAVVAMRIHSICYSFFYIWRVAACAWPPGNCAAFQGRQSRGQSPTWARGVRVRCLGAWVNLVICSVWLEVGMVHILSDERVNCGKLEPHHHDLLHDDNL